MVNEGKCVDNQKWCETDGRLSLHLGLQRFHFILQPKFSHQFDLVVHLGCNDGLIFLWIGFDFGVKCEHLSIATACSMLLVVTIFQVALFG